MSDIDWGFSASMKADELVGRVNRIERLLGVLAESILRHEYGKDLHDVPILTALRDGDLALAEKEWLERR